ncbi:MAG: outer membrane lipoprotein-sorting protein [Desulfobacterales bacterium]|nr:outer membrane lipoprotein-sorting protein [Desulfobacterales bacterium]MDD4071265.1 outer membrane lipoprotein-sorting protein [Desulfobacterales bacterium]MDD4393342.1 outer membrane lipoprotein-sorting protein [Desulfobacterales bacterium]
MMKHITALKILSLCLLITSSFPYTNGFAITATQIIEKSEQAIQGESQIATAEITIKTRRWTRTMKLESYRVRKDKKSFSEILSPRKDAGNRFLMIDQNMWHYVPRLQQTIKISPSMMLQSWMGSDFTNDDIVKESSIVADYTHHMIGNEAVDGHECYKLELIPRPDAAVVWGKIIYYARTSDFLPVREEFYNEHNELKKHLTLSNFQKMGDRIIPVLYKMQTVSKPDRYTLMELESVRFDVPIPETVFTLQYLKKR